MTELDQMKALASSVLDRIGKFESEQAPGHDEKERRQALSECNELVWLLTDPNTWTLQVAWGYSASVALALAFELKLPHLIRVDSSGTSLDELVQQTGASAKLVKCAMHQLTTNGIFQVPTPGRYCHNSQSKCLLDKSTAAWMNYLVDDGLYSGAYFTQSMLKNKLQIPENQRDSAFCQAFQTDKPFYEYYGTQDWRRGARFNTAMEIHAMESYLEMVFPFRSLPDGAMVVDVGGGKGQCCMTLGSKYPGLTFTVQDLLVGNGNNRESRPSDKGINWQNHNFFDPQPIRGAEVYILSNVLMDHRDVDCQRIIRNITDSMVPNKSILLVNDTIDAEPIESPSRLSSALQLHMIASLNRPFRTEKEWRCLFLSADDRVQFHDIIVTQNHRAIMAIGRAK